MNEFVRGAGRIVLIFVLSMAGSYASALVFVAVLTRTLPRSDLAYGQGLKRTFSDPFVVDVARFGATIAGFAVFFVAWWAVRERSLFRSFAICFLTGIAAISVVTPFLGGLGMLAGLIAVGLSLDWCRRSLPLIRTVATSGG